MQLYRLFYWFDDLMIKCWGEDLDDPTRLMNLLMLLCSSILIGLLLAALLVYLLGEWSGFIAVLCLPATAAVWVPYLNRQARPALVTAGFTTAVLMSYVIVVVASLR